MGYESKIIVIDRHELKDDAGKTTGIYGAEIAQFDLCKMGYDYFDGKQFRNLFATPVDFDLSVQNEDSNTVYPDEYWREDMYGEHCKYTTDIDSVIAWLEQYEAHEHYRRAALFLDFLRVLKNRKGEYTQICLVHYGY